mgnify:CR=1 FL=1
MKEGNLVRIVMGIHAGRIGLITEVRKVQNRSKINYLVLYQGWSSPYPYTKRELEVISA